MAERKNITCPGCGAVNPRLRYLEDIVCYREVTGFNDEEELEIDGLYESGEGYDDGENARLTCMDCLREFPIPDGIDVDFV